MVVDDGVWWWMMCIVVDDGSDGVVTGDGVTGGERGVVKGWLKVMKRGEK